MRKRIIFAIIKLTLNGAIAVMSEREKKLSNVTDVIVSRDASHWRVQNLFSRLVPFLHKRVILAIAILIIILVGVGVWQWRAEESRNAAPKLKRAALTIEVNKDISQKKYEAAIKLINNSPDKEDEGNQLLLASVYNNQGDYKAALQIFQQLIKEHGITLGWASSAAEAAESAKDYKQAINYYKQAEVLSQQDKSNVVAGADKRYYDNKIQELQKKL